MRCDGMRALFLFDCLSIDRSINLVSHPLVIRFTKGEQAIYMPFMLNIWKVESSGIAVAMTVVGLAVALSQAVLARPLVVRHRPSYTHTHTHTQACICTHDETKQSINQKKLLL